MPPRVPGPLAFVAALTHAQPQAMARMSSNLIDVNCFKHLWLNVFSLSLVLFFVGIDELLLVWRQSNGRRI